MGRKNGGLPADRRAAHSLTDGLAELVGTGGVLPTTTDALKPFEHLVYIHALNKAGDTLKVAVTATVESDIMEFAVGDFKVYLLAAGL